MNISGHENLLATTVRLSELSRVCQLGSVLWGQGSRSKGIWNLSISNPSPSVLLNFKHILTHSSTRCNCLWKCSTSRLERVPWCLSGLRIWHCYCCGSGCCCDRGLTPGPGIPTCEMWRKGRVLERQRVRAAGAGGAKGPSLGQQQLHLLDDLLTTSSSVPAFPLVSGDTSSLQHHVPQEQHCKAIFTANPTSPCLANVPSKVGI